MGWTVAQTGCISHSAKYRKMANFDPSGSQNLCIDLHETWHGWLRQRHHPTCQIWWSSLNVCGLGTCVKYHIFVSFLFCFLRHAYRSHFLTNLDDLYVKRANDFVFMQHNAPSHRAKATQDFYMKRCSWIHQCWRTDITLSRLEPFRLFSLEHIARC